MQNVFLFLYQFSNILYFLEVHRVVIVKHNFKKFNYRD